MLWPFRLSSGISARNLSIIGRRRRSPPAGRPGGIVAAMRRPVIALVVVLAALGLFAGGLAWLLETPEPPAGASRGVRLYYAYCVTCHGTDGRGSWRATLFLLRPGDLTRVGGESDRYLADIIKHGGAPLGRPGMPAFGFLPDEDIQALVAYVQSLGGGSARAGTAR